jgi:CheY-like chemotaxis protein/anti-sigma regulatory factor (Ser/Thr protein kinase)
VTAFRHAEEELRRINETLEQRVADRTRKLERAMKDAERASEAKTRFLAAVSHDLVQPLNAAQLLTHALIGRVSDKSSRQSLDQISGALGATEDLIEGLLDISRLDAGGMEPRRSRFPLGELFSQLQGEFSVLARERGLELACVETRLWVETDPQLLRRILQNFLSNAVRYTPKGRVLIGCRRRGGRVMIGVWDTGPGLTREDQAVIFEEFRRLGDRQHAPGLGLGLAIAERMARLLGHEIELASQPGRGTVFGVHVPRTEPARAAPQRVADRSEPGSGRVLIVDNEAAMLGSLDTLVSGWGFEVRVAGDAAQARAAAEGFAPELLIVDFHLDDGRTGLELLDGLREAGCAAPAILISADHAAEVRQAARRAGCEFLHKPIRPLALRSVMTRMMPRRRRGS